MLYFHLKTHLVTGLPPDPQGTYSAPPELLTGFKGQGQSPQGRGEEGEGEETKGSEKR